MSKSLTALALLVVTAVVIYNIEPEQSSKPMTSQYLAFLKKYNKPIPKEQEFIYRSQLFAQYVAAMEKHNADPNQKWQMGVNQFSDLTHDEFKATYLGQLSGGQTIDMVEEPVNAGFTEAVDWRTKNVVTAVRNQGACGSCWAFGATASHQSYQVQFQGADISINLSEQQIVDCATQGPYDNHGCNGGYASRALGYIKDHGQTTEEKYPYKAVNQDCAQDSGEWKTFGVAEISGCSSIEKVLREHPIAVRVDASNWHLYKNGIFDNCSTHINHAVFMVGSSDDAWTIKNSWGRTWGEDGYIRLAKGNTCNVCFGPSYAI